MLLLLLLEGLLMLVDNAFATFVLGHIIEVGRQLERMLLLHWRAVCHIVIGPLHRWFAKILLLLQLWLLPLLLHRKALLWYIARSADVVIDQPWMW